MPQTITTPVAQGSSSQKSGITGYTAGGAAVYGNSPSTSSGGSSGTSGGSSAYGGAKPGSQVTLYSSHGVPYTATVPEQNIDPRTQAPGFVPSPTNATQGTSPQVTIPSTAPNAAQVNSPNSPTQVGAGALAGQLPLGQAQANLAKNTGNLSPADLAQAGADLKNHYNQGLTAAQGSGAAPQSSSGGTAGVTSNLSPTKPTLSPEAQAVVDDNQKYLQDFQQAQNSQSQKETLVQQYQDLSNQLGLPALNTELMNMKNVINGTEQDIRDEVSKAGGFATNSQVLALATARNKSLIQNYNDLVQTRTDTLNQLSTTMGLAEKDQAIAQQQIDSKLNFDQQQIQFADKALANSQSALNSMQNSEGWDGIYKATLASGDPQAVARINSTMGNGFDLATMAQFDAQTRAQKLAKEQSDLANVANDNARADRALNETIRHNTVDEANAGNKKGTDDSKAFYGDITTAQTDLSSGKTDWGQTWNRLYSQYQTGDPTQDSYLGKTLDQMLNKDYWAQSGAYSNYKNVISK